MRSSWPVAVAILVAGCAARQQGLIPVEPDRYFPHDTQVRWYDVTGSTAQALRAEMDRLGPEGPGGGRFDAYTTWYVTWRYPFVYVDGQCSLGPVATRLKVDVTLPRWLVPDGVSPELKERWTRYLDALMWHEAGHRDTGLRAASEIADRLPELPPRPTCEEADRIAEDAARAILARHRESDEAYDEETRHGQTQGASFP